LNPETLKWTGVSNPGFEGTVKLDTYRKIIALTINVPELSYTGITGGGISDNGDIKVDTVCVN
jgi:hypothetical protein